MNSRPTPTRRSAVIPVATSPRPCEVGAADSGRRFRKGAVVRTLLHGLAAAGAWILFVYWWAEVLTYTRQEDAWMVVLSLLLTVGLTAVITLVWVRHNIGIYRRKGPRRRLPEVPEESRQDVLGRPLRHPGSEALRRAAVVRVVPGEKEKVMERGEVS